MIQVLPGLLLNSSTKRWYSLGSAKVQGKKSHLDASMRPISRSRFFLYLLRFFTIRFLRVSCSIKQRNRNLQHDSWFELETVVTATTAVSELARLMLPHLIMVAKVVYPDMFLHVWMIKILPEPAHITPVKIPLSITVRKRTDIIYEPVDSSKTLLWWQTDNRTHSLTSTQPGLWRRTSCMVLNRPHL